MWFACCDASTHVNTDAQLVLPKVQKLSTFKGETLKANDDKQFKEAELPKTKTIVDIDEMKLPDLECDTSTAASQSHADDLLDQDSSHSTVADSTEESKFALVEDIYLTGPWSNWKTNSKDGLLEAVPTAATTTGLLKLCVRMTSQSFSFQVITDKLKWDWHLYPKDAKPIKIGFISTHVSKEGFLRAGNKDALIGLGDKKLGHGINFHVVEKPGTVVTVWVEVPTKLASAEGLALRTDTTEGARIWYTVEDTGVQCVVGDGINLDRYKKYLPADIKLE
jgi:hypothetical protein